jgi:hypothetical protein
MDVVAGLIMGGLMRKNVYVGKEKPSAPPILVYPPPYSLPEPFNAPMVRCQILARRSVDDNHSQAQSKSGLDYDLLSHSISVAPTSLDMISQCVAEESKMCRKAASTLLNFSSSRLLFHVCLSELSESFWFKISTRKGFIKCSEA